MIVRRPPITLRKASLLAFSKCIADIWKQCENGPYNHLLKSILYIQDVLRDIPLHLADEVFQEVITRLMIAESKTGRKLSKKIGDFIVKILCDLRVSNLCLGKVNKKFVLQIIDNLHHMTSLRILKMSPFASVKSVTFAVMQMKNITQFSHPGCVDEIISALAFSCKNLQVLDVCNSQDVTDRSMNDLFECKSLKYIDIVSTSVSPSGFASVLHNIPTLEALIYSDNHNALEYLGNVNYTNIFEIGHVLSSDLEKVAQIFPTLKHIEVAVEICKVNEESRYLFPHLQSMLIIEDAQFYYNNIRNLLDVRQFCLNKLQLHLVEYLDTTALENIAESCPNLEDLQLWFCNSNDRSFLTNHYRYYSKANFVNLKKVDIKDCIVDVEFILSRGPNITHLKIDEEEPVCSKAFLDHVHENPLKKLKDLYICVEQEFLDDSFVLEALKSCEYIEKVKYYHNLENLNR